MRHEPPPPLGYAHAPPSLVTLPYIGNARVVGPEPPPPQLAPGPQDALVMRNAFILLGNDYKTMNTDGAYEEAQLQFLDIGDMWKRVCIYIAQPSKNALIDPLLNCILPVVVVIKILTSWSGKSTPPAPCIVK